MERNFLGFRKLFGRFLCDPKSAVQWDKIEKLPDGAVKYLQYQLIISHEMTYIFLKGV